ncbi:hypothetical protein F8M41_018354 [Gigaspora margarita]|uniref:Uncharacterized protein n=1 Tax=Gigaspora margarita TaxID=4874 RepID=A0A8H4ALK9_GIGMA|nr:hypothetical protein F8M41_018354 [Gigaspora margarita]
MPPKVSSFRKPVTRKTRNITKKSTQIEPDVSKHLQISKRLQKSNQVKDQRLSNQNRHLVEDESSLPLQMSRRSINSSAQSIEPRINSFSKQSDWCLSNQNHYDLDKVESSKDEIFSSFGQNYNLNPLKELSYSNIQSYMQNVNSYLD